MPTMTDEQIRKTAKFYGISVDEAYERYLKVQAHQDDPLDPICVGCARRPYEIQGYLDMILDGLSGNLVGETRLYVIENEGTYNPENGHFLCDTCYIKNGMPSAPGGWVCP